MVELVILFETNFNKVKYIGSTEISYQFSFGFAGSDLRRNKATSPRTSTILPIHFSAAMKTLVLSN